MVVDVVQDRGIIDVEIDRFVGVRLDDGLCSHPRIGVSQLVEDSARPKMPDARDGPR